MTEKARSEKEVQRQIQTNVFGPLYTMQALLPEMRSRRSGTIVNISSVLASDVLPSCGIHAASKASLESLTSSLALEVKEFGITVLVVEPGAFRTNFLTSAMKNEKGISEEYTDTAAHKTLQALDNLNGKQPGDSVKGAERIYELVTGEGMAGKLKGQVHKLILGKDAFARVEKQANSIRHDMEIGQEVSFSTEIDG